MTTKPYWCGIWFAADLSSYSVVSPLTAARKHLFNVLPILSWERGKAHSFLLCAFSGISCLLLLPVVACRVLFLLEGAPTVVVQRQSSVLCRCYRTSGTSTSLKRSSRLLFFVEQSLPLFPTVFPALLPPSLNGLYIYITLEECTCQMPHEHTCPFKYTALAHTETYQNPRYV